MTHHRNNYDVNNYTAVALHLMDLRVCDDRHV